MGTDKKFNAKVLGDLSSYMMHVRDFAKVVMAH